VNWRKSVSTLYQGIARSLDQDLIPYEYEDWLAYSNHPAFDDTYYNFVHSVNITIPVPDILVLKKYDRLPQRDVKYTRENIFHRDNHLCAYCGKKFKLDQLTVDHIKPKSKGGDNTWKNTITSCKACNNKKSDKTLVEAGMTLLFEPKEPRWCDTLSKMASRPELRPNWSKFLSSIGA